MPCRISAFAGFDDSDCTLAFYRPTAMMAGFADPALVAFATEAEASMTAIVDDLK